MKEIEIIVPVEGKGKGKGKCVLNVDNSFIFEILSLKSLVKVNSTL